MLKSILQWMSTLDPTSLKYLHRALSVHAKLPNLLSILSQTTSLLMPWINPIKLMVQAKPHSFFLMWIVIPPWLRFWKNWIEGRGWEPLWRQVLGQRNVLWPYRSLYLLWVCMDSVPSSDWQFTYQQEHSKQHRSPRISQELYSAAWVRRASR